MSKINLELIKSRRLEKKISLQKMAELLGFRNASNYYKYESGDYSFNAGHLPVIAEKLDLQVSDIFCA